MTTPDDTNLVEELRADMDAGREWMRRAWYELNTIRARDGAPSGVAEEWWSELTDALGAMLGDDTLPWMTTAAKLLVAPYEARAAAAESALSAARTAAFREAAEVARKRREYWNAVAYDKRQAGKDDSFACAKAQGCWDAADAIDAKAKEDTQP